MKIDYNWQLYNTTSQERLKNLTAYTWKYKNIHRSLHKIPVEVLHLEANYPFLELRRNELGLILLHTMRSNTLIQTSYSHCMIEWTKTMKILKE